MRAEFRCLESNRDIRIAHLIAFLADQTDNFCEKSLAVDSFETRIAVRKMIPDVS